MKQWSIADRPAAALIAIGDEDNPVTTLIQNVDPNNTLYIGNDPGINPLNPLTCAPLAPGQSTVSDGTQDIFAIAATGQTVQVNTYRGVSSFFQPTSLGAIGGAAIYVQTIAPTGTIPVNSLWFNTANNSILTWNGTAWVNQVFNAQNILVAATITATQVANGTLPGSKLTAAAAILGSQIASATIQGSNIAANTIAAANIAANTITAAQLASGIVYAGIVNGTLIQGATLLAGNNAAQPQIQIQDVSGVGTITVLLNQAGYTNPILQGAIIASGANHFGQLNINGGSRTGANDDFVGLELNSSDNGSPTPSSANFGMYYTDTSGTSHNYAFVDKSGLNAQQLSLWPGGVPSVVNPYGCGQLYALSQGTPGIQTPNGVFGIIPITKSDFTTFVNTTTSMNRMSQLWTIPGNDYYNNVIYRFRAWGHGVQGSTQDQLNMQMSGFGLTFAGNNMPATDIPASASFHWRYEIDIIINGGTGIIYGGSFTWSQAAVTANRGTAAIDGSNTPLPSGNTNMALQIAWAATTGAPTVTCSGSTWERLAA